MNGRDVEAASSDDHIALGTVVPWDASLAPGKGYVLIEIDHLETIPEVGQRVRIVDGWDTQDLGDSPEQADTKPTGDEDA